MYFHKTLSGYEIAVTAELPLYDTTPQNGINSKKKRKRPPRVVTPAATTRNPVPSRRIGRATTSQYKGKFAATYLYSFLHSISVARYSGGPAEREIFIFFLSYKGTENDRTNLSGLRGNDEDEKGYRIEGTDVCTCAESKRRGRVKIVNFPNAYGPLRLGGLPVCMPIEEAAREEETIYKAAGLSG